jgi:Lsr2
MRNTGPRTNGVSMAQRTQVILEDDLDGGSASETVRFSLDGQSYELDLNARNSAAFRKAVERYVAAARKAGGRAPSRVRSRRSATGPDPKAVRAWAASNKVKVSPRGRIPAAVVAKFEAAGN